jgi:hypothetical protein
MRQLTLLLLLLASPALADDPATPSPAAPPAPSATAVEATPATAAPAPVQPPTEATPPPTTAPVAAPVAPVAATPPPDEAVPAPPPPPPSEAPLPRFGLRLGAGVPDGATADFVYRPQRWLRLQAGPAWNYLAWGFQGGVAITPIRWAISPVVEVRYGHFFGVDLNQKFKSIDPELKPLVSDVGYDYVNGQLAFEFGSPRGFTFSLGIGLCWFWTSIHGTATTVQNAGTPDEVTVTVTDPSLKAMLPSLRLGMLYYF